MNKMVDGAKIKYSGTSIVEQTSRSIHKGSGRFLSLSENSSHWFGGIVDTLTSFGVLKFFFMCAFFLTFVRYVFSGNGTNAIGFSTLLDILSNAPSVDMDWFNTLVSNLNTNLAIKVQTNTLYSLVLALVNLFLFIPRIIITILTGAVNIIIFFGYFCSWLTMGSIVLG